MYAMLLIANEGTVFLCLNLAVSRSKELNRSFICGLKTAFNFEVEKWLNVLNVKKQLKVILPGLSEQNFVLTNVDIPG
jgi:hypothetical protein